MVLVRVIMVVLYIIYFRPYPGRAKSSSSLLGYYKVTPDLNIAISL